MERREIALPIPAKVWVGHYDADIDGIMHSPSS